MSDIEHTYDIAVKQVFQQYYPALVFFAQKLVKSKEDAEDITDDVFVKLWQKEPDFSQYKNIKAVLYISVKNACLNYIQQQKRKLIHKLGYNYFKREETESFILATITRAEMLQMVYDELQQLPPEQRRVMHLLFREGLGKDQVAEQLNISIHTVKKHKLNGIRTLRKKLKIFLNLLV